MPHFLPQNADSLAVPTRYRIAIIAVLVALLMGCGGDKMNAANDLNAQDTPWDDATNGGNNNFSDAQNTAQDTGYEPHDSGSSSDTASYADASDFTDASGVSNTDSSYTPDLDASGGSDGACETERVGSDLVAPTGARVFVPSYRFDLDALESHQSFREHIHQLVRNKVLPCMPRQGASLVLFPEAMSLPMLLIGPKAAQVRQMSDSNRALSSMITAVPDAFGYYGEKYPNSSPNSRFILAMTDPVVRATYDTFGSIAALYNLYLSVTVTLPEFKRVDDPDRVARLADPDITAPAYAYEADSSDVYSRQILFGPDGEVVDETRKTYLSSMGREQLGLSDARLSAVHTFETPWGPSAVTISNAALMPNVQDRLDDLGAQVLLQPNAQTGGWATAQNLPIDLPDEDGVNATSIWQPDRFMLGAYNLVQRSPRVSRSYVSQMTGNFFEITLDGQVQMVADAQTHPESDAFIGQQNSAPGNFFVGPWVVDDPSGAHPEWSVAQRRDELQQAGAELSQDSGSSSDTSFVDDVWSNDLRAELQYPGTVETQPAVVATSEHIYLATSKGDIGQRALHLQVYQPGDIGGVSTPDTHQPITESAVTVPGYDLVRPAIAAGDQRIYIVAELIAENENRLAYFAYDSTQNQFVGTPKIIDTDFVGQRAYHPSIKAGADVLNMTWVQEINGVNRALFAQTSLSAPFENLSVRTEIADRADDVMSAQPGGTQGMNAPQPPASQWDARLAVSPGAIAVTWMNYRAPHWEILASASVDGGLSWSRPTRVDAVPEYVQALNASPTIESMGARKFALAWTDARASRPNTRIGVTMLAVSPNGAVTPTQPARLIDAQLPIDIGADLQEQTHWFWRPTIVRNGDLMSVYYEALNGAERSIQRAQFNAQGSPIGTQTITINGGNGGYFPAAAPTDYGVFVAYETLAPDDVGGSIVQVIRPTLD